MLVLDQGLGQCRFLVDHIDQIVHHTPFTAHDQVQIAQADVKVEHSGFVAAHGQTRCKTGAGSGLANPAFAGRNNDDFCHEELLCYALRDRVQEPPKRGELPCPQLIR